MSIPEEIGQEGSGKKRETQAMIAAVALGKDPRKATQTQSLVTEVTLRLSHGNRVVTALVDCGAQENFLSQKIVVEESLTAQPTTIGAYTIDGHRIAVYGRHALETQATDINGNKRIL